MKISNAIWLLFGTIFFASLGIGKYKKYFEKEIEDLNEKEILDLLCASRTAKEIAYDLDLSINTVQMYVKSLFKKTNQNRTTDLVLYAIKNGLNNPIS